MAGSQDSRDLWKGQLVITFGKHAGQTFRWLVENDVGWLVWLLFQYCQQGEQNELLKWQKERLLRQTGLRSSTGTSITRLERDVVRSGAKLS